ncbi:MAG: neutral/alkaline non-lysosomal ceramidase N-terminal domain-containing protein [Verrucomicrobiota bacterium]
MKAILTLLLLFALSHICCSAVETDLPTTWKVGIATADITPGQPIRMAGYGGRKKPSQGTVEALHAKAITFEDNKGNRSVMVTLDLIGVIAELRKQVAAEVQKKYKIAPDALLLNASHTHCGPAYGRDDAKDYFDSMVKKIVAAIGESITKLTPAHISYSHARAGFAINRRYPTTDRGFINSPHPDGPVDHDVPVLRITDNKNQLQAVVFGYACHNTTMGFRQIYGDYAGYAQKYFEQDHPGTTALFMMGCGGDQNPYPRSSLILAQKHGRSLAMAIEAALVTKQKALHGPLKTSFTTVDLEFTDNDRAPFPYPIQIIQFGQDLSLIALGTEVVVDYSLRLKRELADRGPAIWVAGYSNVYSGYIPSKRVLLEGGYEAKSRPWKPELEERIITTTHKLFDNLNPE